MMRLDEELTWPRGVLALLEGNVALLRDYERARAERDKRMEDDDMARLEPDTNPFRERRDAVLAALAEVVNGVSLVGYHCTRLTEFEIKSVREAGLQTLRPSLFEGRIAQASNQGLLPSVVADRLLRNNEGRNDHRAGMIWFIFRVGDLRDESGVTRLLSYWGGEALYGSHENDPHVEPALRSLGKPCIVEALLPAAGIESHCLVSERIMRVFLEERSIRTGHGSGMQGYVTADVPAASISAVITGDDGAFERLTGASTWYDALS